MVAGDTRGEGVPPYSRLRLRGRDLYIARTLVGTRTVGTGTIPYLCTMFFKNKGYFTLEHGRHTISNRNKILTKITRSLSARRSHIYIGLYITLIIQSKCTLFHCSRRLLLLKARLSSRILPVDVVVISAEEDYQHQMYRHRQMNERGNQYNRASRTLPKSTVPTAVCAIHLLYRT